MSARRVLDVVVAVYVGTVVVPAAYLLAATGGGPTSATFLAGVGVGVFLIAVAAAGAAEDLPAAVVGFPAWTLFVLPPLSYAAVLVLVDDPALERAALVGIGALVAGTVALGVALGVRNRRRREAATDLLVLGGDGDDGVLGVFVAAVLGLGLVVVVGLVAVGGSVEALSSTFVVVAGGASSTLLIVLEDDETVAVTDRGLRHGNAVVPWERYRGYRLADDALVLVADQWWRPSREVELGEADREAVGEVVGRYLPRLDDEGRVRTPATGAS